VQAILGTGEEIVSRQQVFRHLVLPSVAPAALIGLYFTPKAVFGCANRGYMAVSVVFLALAAAVAAARKGIAARRRGDTGAANRWLLTALVLISPIVLLAGPLG